MRYGLVCLGTYTNVLENCTRWMFDLVPLIELALMDIIEAGKRANRAKAISTKNERRCLFIGYDLV